MITFCWLPPDRLLIGVSRLAVLIWSRSIYLSAASSISFRLIGWNIPFFAWSAMIMFSRTDRSAKMPSFLRSSGKYAIPSFIASSGDLILTSLPFTLIVPPSGLSAPYIARTSSERPDPKSPVSPTTSPLLTVKSNGRMLPFRPTCSASTTGIYCSSFLWSPLISARSSKFLPIILATNSTRGNSFTGYSPTKCPFLNTVILSHTSYTCSRKCVTKIIPTPWSFSLRINTNNFSTSSSSRDDVGSSKINTWHFISTALAIAIICCFAIEHSSNLSVARASIDKLFSNAADFLFIVCQSIIPSFLGSLPINKFSATVRFGHRFTSWYTVLIPCSCASCGDRLMIAPSDPAIKISPLSKECTPVSTLINVDFPAPFSPINAWISPLRSVKSTCCNAFTPGNVLEMSCILNTTLFSIKIHPLSTVYDLFSRAICFVPLHYFSVRSVLKNCAKMAWQ